VSSTSNTTTSKKSLRRNDIISSNQFKPFKQSKAKGVFGFSREKNGSKIMYRRAHEVDSICVSMKSLSKRVRWNDSTKFTFIPKRDEYLPIHSQIWWRRNELEDIQRSFLSRAVPLMRLHKINEMKAIRMVVEDELKEIDQMK
jgi:hypothetical protein